MALTRFQLAGFGGQGILLIGKLIAQAAMMDDKEVTWMPAYGPEMRGGTANCTVCVDDETPITSPIVNRCDVLVAMNGASLKKFENMVVPGGHIFINTSLCPDPSSRKDVTVHYVDSTAIAEEKFGSPKAANMVMLGAIMKVTGFSTPETFKAVFEETMEGPKAKFIPMNMEALTAWEE